MNKAKKLRFLLGFILLVISSSLVFVVFANIPRDTNLLKVSFLDIGQGDSIFIESPTGVQILVDAGPDKRVLSKISQVIPFYDRNIDIVVATHPDKDHIGGIPSILEKYTVNMLLESGATSENGVYDEINKIANDLEEKGVLQRIIAHNGQSIEIGGGAVLKILYPDRDITGLPTNDASIVALLEYKDETFLLTGDAPFETEFRLLRNPLLQKVTVLKVGHHGSQYSTGSLFLDRIHPNFAVISVGKNTYGHPTQTVLDILSNYNAKILRTDQSGTIGFITDGNTISYKTQK